MRSPAVSTCCLALALASTPALARLPFEGQAAVEFMATADVVAMKPLPFGVTKPFKVTLDDGERTAHAVWKTIDAVNPHHRHFSTDRAETYFRDSYRHEIAAYELDELLGLGLIPPTIERQIDGQRGSLQLWVENSITEAKRLKLERLPPDSRRWSEQRYAVRLLHQLTGDTDASNVSNILVDPDFRLYVIDSSRAFHLRGALHRAEGLRRFPKPVLERLRALTPEILDEKLGPWLTRGQLKALIARRDRLVELAARLIADQGEKAALFAWRKPSPGPTVLPE
ncbi:MAG: hypothetical protein GY719_20040 [bacterium]|nr:hypothetical protein [bacterium]